MQMIHDEFFELLKAPTLAELEYHWDKFKQMYKIFNVKQKDTENLAYIEATGLNALNYLTQTVIINFIIV